MVVDLLDYGSQGLHGRSLAQLVNPSSHAARQADVGAARIIKGTGIRRRMSAVVRNCPNADDPRRSGQPARSDPIPEDRARG